MTYRRYAVYYTPTPGPFADYAAAWLGWDARTGETPKRPVLPDLPVDLDVITQTPQRYGVHATLKPPFRLLEGASATELAAEIAKVAAESAPFELPRMRVTQMGRFIALVPEPQPAALSDLAARCVTALDRFRAPTTPEELARRRAKSTLNAQQEVYLQTWGYPYVLDQFRFHITLTGRLDKSHLDPIRTVLEKTLSPLLPQPYPIESISLVGEDDKGFFHELHRYTLSG